MQSGSNNSHSEAKGTIAAEYIAIEMSRLARMACANGFPLLAYLIDMAVLEAWREANEPNRHQAAGAATLANPEPQTHFNLGAGHRSETR
ncbi:MAG: hypothetical protein H0T75_04255 [Rhizobiales bacterium]|nr:hypothetical protein [Hyphomicrobiales bacterium]